jgi:hypothetical protein
VVTRRLRSIGLAVTAGLLAGTLGVTVAAAQQEDAPPAAGDAGLLERLDELEPQLPAQPAPTAVTIEDDGTWGGLEGDVTGAAATLGTLERDLLSLYVDADDTRTPVGDAVADVARGWLDLQHAYDRLAAWEAADLAFPIDARDDEGTATDADELRGTAEAGLNLVLSARQRHLTGYVALRELGAAEPDAQQRLDARAAEAEDFDRDVRPLVQRLVSLRTTQLLVPVDRFATTAPGVEARARSMTVVCVDREAYLDATGASPAEGGAPIDPTDADAALALLGPAADREDCPALADEVGVEVRDPAATDEDEAEAADEDEDEDARATRTDLGRRGSRMGTALGVG